MSSFWIIGAGRFGSLAVRRLLEKEPGSQLLLVDHDASMLARIESRRVVMLERDGIDFLVNHPGSGPEWIVPAIPVHVAFAWLCRKLAMEATVTQLPVPNLLDGQLPNASRSQQGTLYSSFASFRCPDNCDEPAELCTITGKPRRASLFELLRQVRAPGYRVRVVRSRQLAPGVGGYQLADLWRLLAEIRSLEPPALVATACRCHGVVDALQWRLASGHRPRDSNRSGKTPGGIRIDGPGRCRYTLKKSGNKGSYAIGLNGRAVADVGSWRVRVSKGGDHEGQRRFGSS